MQNLPAAETQAQIPFDGHEDRPFLQAGNGGHHGIPERDRHQLQEMAKRGKKLGRLGGQKMVGTRGGTWDIG